MNHARSAPYTNDRSSSSSDNDSPIPIIPRGQQSAPFGSIHVPSKATQQQNNNNNKKHNRASPMQVYNPVMRNKLDNQKDEIKIMYGTNFEGILCI